MGRKGLTFRIAKSVKKVIFFLFAIQFIYIILLKWLDPPITLTQLNSFISGEGLNRDYVAIEAISPNVALAVIASEDQLFADHNGFDVKSIKKALETHHQKKATRLRGASTISQQVAKNVFLWQGRSWIRKGLETYFTFMIEVVWGKKRILEVYLNVAEMGNGIFGIEAASRHYFKKSAHGLTKTESAKIAASLPNPKKYIVSPPSPYITRRHLWVLGQMHNLEGDKAISQLTGDMRKSPK
jgi:monofunctional biosynthetic peptidoglycan transglycosylase